MKLCLCQEAPISYVTTDALPDTTPKEFVSPPKIGLGTECVTHYTMESLQVCLQITPVIS